MSDLFGDDNRKDRQDSGPTIGDMRNSRRPAYNDIYKNFDKKDKSGRIIYMPYLIDDELTLNTNDTIGIRRSLLEGKTISLDEYKNFIPDSKVFEKDIDIRATDLAIYKCHRENKYENNEWNSYLNSIINAPIRNATELYIIRLEATKCLRVVQDDPFKIELEKFFTNFDKIERAERKQREEQHLNMFLSRIRKFEILNTRIQEIATPYII